MNAIGISQTLPLLWQNLCCERLSSRRKVEIPIHLLEDFNLQLQLFNTAQIRKTNIPIHVPWGILTYPLFLRISLLFVFHQPHTLLFRNSSKPARVPSVRTAHSTLHSWPSCSSPDCQQAKQAHSSLTIPMLDQLGASTTCILTQSISGQD